MNIFDIFDLSGKVSIVSGGGDGLGQIISTGLAEAGSDVVVCSRRREICEEAAHEIEKTGVKTLAVPCDITVDEDVDRLINTSLKAFSKIDVLVNNAGRTWGASPEDIEIENWLKVIELNVNGTFRCTQKVGKVMIEQKGGKIINISSYSGSMGSDPEYLNAIPYNTSKGAINTFTKDLAVKWAKYNINVNCIAPGWFPTKMTDWLFSNKGEAILSKVLLKRYGNENDLKGAAVYLASKASDYITGHILAVDGGLSAW